MDFKDWKIPELVPIVENEKITITMSDVRETALHRHRSFLELAYVIQGRANHVIDGKSSIISKGDYFIVDYGTRHRYTQIGDTPFIVVNCLFVPQLIDQTLNNCQCFEEVINNYLINFDFCQLKERPTNLILHDSDGHMWKMIRRLCEEYKHKEIGFLESMRCQLILILIDIMRQLKLPHSDFVQLYKRMLFNEYAKNYDDHTKNVTFLMDKKGTWRLSPAYDMTFSYNKNSTWVNAHQMLINGKADEITKDDLVKVAEKAGIKPSDAEKYIKQVKKIVSKWEDYAQEAGLSSKNTERIRSFFNLNL